MRACKANYRHRGNVKTIVVRVNGVSELNNFRILTVTKLPFLALFCQQIYIISVQYEKVVGLCVQSAGTALASPYNVKNTYIAAVRASGASENDTFSHLFVPETRFLHYFLSVYNCILNVGHIVTVDDFPVLFMT